jgi:hypothetical protein
VLIPTGRIFIMRVLDWIPAFAGMTKKWGNSSGVTPPVKPFKKVTLHGIVETFKK